MRTLVIVGALGCVATVSARGQDPVSRISVDTSGGDSDSQSGGSSASHLSADGRYVAFESNASDLVANDTNGENDIFVRDRASGTTVRVNVDSAGVEAAGISTELAISADGRFVAFSSVATNLVAGDGNGVMDVFVHDRDPDVNGIFDEGNGVTIRASVDSSGVAGNLDSVTPSISGDGNVIAFASAATNLTASDKNAATDIFVRDVAAGTTARVSTISGLDANGASSAPSISADGLLIAFSSFANNLIGGDTNGARDIYVTDPGATFMTRVSVDSSGNEGNDDSSRVWLSRDGTVAAFQSAATDLVANDTNFVSDIFVHELASGVTTRVSVDGSGNEGNGDSVSPTLSKDGLIVGFESSADNFVANDTNFSPDIFVHDRTTGATECMTVNGVGLIANGFGSNRPVMSGDGLIVAFSSSADNLVLGDGNFVMDVFARDRAVIPPVASWVNYGSGFPGLIGIPTLTASANPVFGTNISLDASNSSGSPTLCLFMLGIAPDSVLTNRGGTLLVDISLVLPLQMDAIGVSVSSIVPQDLVLYGIHVYAQAIMLDAGASRGFSFTPGLDLTLGL